jgi:hypothetical protein
MNYIIKYLFTLLMLATLSACSNVYNAEYPTYAAAVQAGAVKSGWVPEMVPKTAIDLREQHDIDSNDVWLRFTLPSADKGQIFNNLKKLSDADIMKIKIRYPRKSDWWFEGLIQQSPANDNALNSDIYTFKCHNEKNGYIAFERNSLKVYYWCTY